MRILRTIQNISSEASPSFGGGNIWNESDDGFPERPGMVLNLNASSRVKCAKRKRREREREEGEGRKVAQKLERSVLGSSTRQLGHRKTRYASIFIFGSLPKFRPGRSHLSKLSSVCDNISSLLPSPYLFLSFLPLSLYRPPHKKFLEYRLKFGYLLTSIYTRDKCKQFYVQWKSIQSLFMIFR